MLASDQCAPKRVPKIAVSFASEEQAAGRRSICGDFVKPSDGLEPSTPSLPLSDEAGSAGKAGKPRARKPRKKKESTEDE
jgi:hypothetical protein